MARACVRESDGTTHDAFILGEEAAEAVSSVPVWPCRVGVRHHGSVLAHDCSPSALEHEMRIKVKSSRTLKCKAHRPFVDQFTARVLLSSI